MSNLSDILKKPETWASVASVIFALAFFVALAIALQSCHVYWTYSVTRQYTSTNQKPTSVQVTYPAP